MTSSAQTGFRRRDPARLSLLASAIAGRGLEVASEVPGGTPWTDGTTVFVDARDPPGRQLAAVVVQSSLLRAGSLEASVLRTLVRRPKLAPKYLAIEGHRALKAAEALLPGSTARLVDESIANRTASPGDSLDLAKAGVVPGGPPDIFGTIRPKRIKDLGVSRPDGSNGQEASSRTRRTPPLTDLDSGGGVDEDDAGDPFSSPVGGGGGIGRLLKRLFSEGRSAGTGPPGADSATHRSRQNHPRRPTATLSTRPVSISDIRAAPSSGSATYPEWDERIRRYRRDWCTVLEVAPEVADHRPVVPASAPLRAPLGRLGIDLERYRRQMQGDDVDVDAAVEAQVDRRTGSAPGEAVYVDTLRRKRNLAVLILLDVSGSAGEPSLTGVPVHVHQQAAAAVLMTALSELGDRVAMYGFRSRGRSAVHVLPVKRFDEAVDEVVMLRLGGLSPAAYTRLGAAIRHGTTILEREAGTARRLLVVLSDGFAYDHGYERVHGEADTRRALAETRRRGVGTLCLSVGATVDANDLRRVFGVAAYARLPEVAQLAGVVGPLFHAAVRSAEVQRMAWQRRERIRFRQAVEQGRA